MTAFKARIESGQTEVTESERAERRRLRNENADLKVDRAFLESVWQLRRCYRPVTQSVLHAQRKNAPASARLRGQAGNKRLHHRWVAFAARKKRLVIANVAAARELAGWCWSPAVMNG